MRSVLYVLVIKKTQLSCSKLKIFKKIKLSVSLINRDSRTFSLFLSLPCCCQCRFKRYRAKQTNSKTEETIPLWRQPAFLTTCLLSFPFFFDMASHKSKFVLSLFFTWIFSLQQKTSEISPSVLSFISFFFKYNVYRHTDVHTDRYICVLYYLEIVSCLYFFF